MAEELIISTNTTKEQTYQELMPQIEALVAGEPNMLANISNMMSALKYTFDWLWVGVYFVREDELVLGPFQGPIACTRIQLGRGVSGTAWNNKETIVVANVDEFPDHIICNAASKSEIVIPVFDKQNEVALILDIDSDKLNDFDEVDEKYLTQVVRLIESFL